MNKLIVIQYSVQFGCKYENMVKYNMIDYLQLLYNIYVIFMQPFSF
jgi:hypothetical protein